MPEDEDVTPDDAPQESETIATELHQGTVQAFTLHLPEFEGPLDVLLRLIEEQQLEITAISVASVADQFIAHLNNLVARDPHTMSNFVQVAARLILLKSRALLPQVQNQLELQISETDEEDLVAQLKAYQLYKRAAQQLHRREQLNLHSYPVSPPPISKPTSRTLPLDNVTIDVLARAMQRVVDRLLPPPNADYMVSRLPFTVHDCIDRIRDRVRINNRVAFTEILFGVDTRQEVVIMLLALLELLKRFAVRASQDAMFGEIYIEAETEHMLQEAIPLEEQLFVGVENAESRERGPE